MSSQEKASIQFVNFLVKESHIIFRQLGEYKIDINFIPGGIVNKSINQFVLQIAVNVNDVDNAFSIVIVTESYFSYSADANIAEYIEGLFINNAPAIVFPYIRAYISSLTALSGMPTLTLPTLNLVQLGADLKANINVVE